MNNNNNKRNKIKQTDLSISELFDPFTVGFLKSCLEEFDDDEEILELETRSSKLVSGEFGEDEYLYACSITTNRRAYDFD